MGHDKALALTFELTLELMQARLGLLEARLGLLERFGGAVALSADASDLFATGSIAVPSLLGFVFPLTLLLDSRVVEFEDGVHW